MKAQDWFWVVVEAIIWYGFFYYLLYAIQNSTTLWQSALVLLILVYLGIIACPWVRNTEAWKKMWGK